MSLTILKPGILDSIQDCGRFGFQHTGINTNGAVDQFSFRLANAILGKDLNLPVLEFHFPAARIQFKKETIICICGGDFSPAINDQPIPLNHAIMVSKNAVLSFQKLLSGARCYLSVLSALDLKKWMNSFSTNLKAGVGGLYGEPLKKGDQINYEADKKIRAFIQNSHFIILPWKTAEPEKPKTTIEFIKGSEWHWLNSESQSAFQENLFQLSIDADRMGYRLNGRALSLKNSEQLVSSAVSFGTIQLLPNGNLIVLMADHQTTGGYPRIAHVITAHLPLLAQKTYNDVIQFKLTDLESAENKIIEQEKYLRYLQDVCYYRIENLLNAPV